MEPRAQDDHAGHDPGSHVAPGDADTLDPDDHAGHDHGEEEAEGLRLTPEQRARFGIVVATAGPGSLQEEVRLPGEVVFNQDRVVHMVPRVAGIAREVYKSVGDLVEAGEVAAVIESRELADAKAGYLAARARFALAERHFEREKALREKQVSSERDYLEAEQSLAEARIEVRSAGQKLHALGLAAREVEALEDEPDAAITRYEIRSPIAGVVTEKHIALGESLAADADIFTVADMSSVWVNLAVYTKNLEAVRPRQMVSLRAEHSGAEATGEIAMVTPFVDAATRSATARVVLDNANGRWVPGTFVSGVLGTSPERLPVVAPREAVQTIDGRDVVFVEREGRFVMTPVTLGRADRAQIEVSAGLAAGTRYVSRGAFQLKAAVVTSTLDPHAGHGH